MGEETMKTKLTRKQMRLLLTLISIAIFASSYVFIYLKYVDLTESTKTQTQELYKKIAIREQELSELEIKKENTTTMTEQYEDIIKIYPVNITKEDNYMFIEEMEASLNMKIPSVTINDNTTFFTTILPIRNEKGEEMVINQPVDEVQTSTLVENNTAAPAAEDLGELEETIATDNSATELPETNTDQVAPQVMTGIIGSITINFQTTYQGFKRLVDYINHYPEKTSIANASLSFDSNTGGLIGSMVINRYALTGSGKVYEVPYIDDISIGTKNIFGTDVKPNNQTENASNETSEGEVIQ
jgi:hypothetical protein